MQKIFEVRKINYKRGKAALEKGSLFVGNAVCLERGAKGTLEFKKGQEELDGKEIFFEQKKLCDSNMGASAVDFGFYFCKNDYEGKSYSGIQRRICGDGRTAFAVEFYIL